MTYHDLLDDPPGPCRPCWCGLHDECLRGSNDPACVCSCHYTPPTEVGT